MDRDEKGRFISGNKHQFNTESGREANKAQKKSIQNFTIFLDDICRENGLKKDEIPAILKPAIERWYYQKATAKEVDQVLAYFSQKKDSEPVKPVKKKPEMSLRSAREWVKIYRSAAEVDQVKLENESLKADNNKMRMRLEHLESILKMKKDKTNGTYIGG